MAASTVGGGAKEIGTLFDLSGVPIRHHTADSVEMETWRQGVYGVEEGIGGVIEKGMRRETMDMR